LLARVSAVLRRSQHDDGDKNQFPQLASGEGIEFGEFRIFPERYEVMLADETIPLRPKEFEVLMYLVQRPGVVVTRDDLMNIVWGFDYIGGERTVDVHVSSLRKKLELTPQSVKIESIRGVGYKLVLPKRKPKPDIS
jgi:two-component system alkaline phosphatase synthesis response regulator PhoP